MPREEEEKRKQIPCLFRRNRLRVLTSLYGLNLGTTNGVGIMHAGSVQQELVIWHGWGYSSYVKQTQSPPLPHQTHRPPQTRQRDVSLRVENADPRLTSVKLQATL
jgi:hypothetical protein